MLRSDTDVAVDAAVSGALGNAARPEPTASENAPFYFHCCNQVPACEPI